MNAKPNHPGRIAAFQLINGTEEYPAESREAGYRDGPEDSGETTGSPVSTHPAGANGGGGAAETMPIDVFVTLLQDMLRNVLPKFEPAAMMEFREVLEREITSALEAKGVRERQPATEVESRGQRDRVETFKEWLNNITHVSDLDDIKKAACSRIKLLTKGNSYKRKIIKGKPYLYEVYWDAREKKKKYKYIGPAPVADEARDPTNNGNGTHS